PIWRPPGSPFFPYTPLFRSEGVRLNETGISSRDWEGYPVLRFSEVPEIAVELIDASTDRPPLGVGEASGGPTVAAIGNAVAHALDRKSTRLNSSHVAISYAV